MILNSWFKLLRVSKDIIPHSKHATVEEDTYCGRCRFWGPDGPTWPDGKLVSDQRWCNCPNKYRNGGKGSTEYNDRCKLFEPKPK